MNDLENAKALIEKKTLRVLDPPSESRPPRLFVTLTDTQVSDMPEQVCVVMVEKSPGVEARFHLSIGRDRQGNPRVQLRAIKSADSGATNNERVVNVSGKYVNWED